MPPRAEEDFWPYFVSLLHLITNPSLEALENIAANTDSETLLVASEAGRSPNMLSSIKKSWVK
jgi:hypothetical protein